MNVFTTIDAALSRVREKAELYDLLETERAKALELAIGYTATHANHYYVSYWSIGKTTRHVRHHTDLHEAVSFIRHLVTTP